MIAVRHWKGFGSTSLPHGRYRQILFDVPSNDRIKVLVYLKPKIDRACVVDRRRPAEHHALNALAKLPADSLRDLGSRNTLERGGHFAYRQRNAGDVHPASISEHVGRQLIRPEQA